MALEITDTNFDQILSQNERVIVQFSAVWCGPCRMITPIIEQLAEENKDVFIGKLDVDGNPNVSGLFGISSIPTILYFKNGKLWETTRGVMSKPKLQEYINKLKE